MSISKTGKKLSLEHKKKLSESHKGQKSWIKGKHHSQKTRKKLSISHMGQKPGNTGKKHSEESKQKMSKSHIGQKAWNKGKTGIYSKQVRKKLRMARQRQIAIQYSNGLPASPTVGFMEQKCLDELRKSTIFKIKGQHPVYGYFLDGYIKNLNLGIEFDEKYHFNKDGTYREYDIDRQLDIARELCCIILRISQNRWEFNKDKVILDFKNMIEELKNDKRIVCNRTS